MVYNFYGAPYDVREAESDILSQKVADCISREGRIDSSFFADDNFNQRINNTFLKNCRINFNVENDYGENPAIQYFFEAEFYRIENTNSPVFSFYEGNQNWKIDCGIKKEDSKEYKNLVKCTERRFYALDSKDSQYLIKILSAVAKSEKNVE